MPLDTLGPNRGSLEHWVCFPFAAAGRFRTVSATPSVRFILVVVPPLGGLTLGSQVIQLAVMPLLATVVAVTPPPAVVDVVNVRCGLFWEAQFPHIRLMHFCNHLDGAKSPS